MAGSAGPFLLHCGLQLCFRSCVLKIISACSTVAACHIFQGLGFRELLYFWEFWNAGSRELS